jgi:hypothetical protein
MTAGYSGTPLPKKLGIKTGHWVALLHEPPGFRATLSPLPDDVTLLNAVGKDALDVILLFVGTERDLAEQFAGAARALQPAGGLWVCWPKKASGIATDLTENVVRGIGLAAGLVDNKVCAVDATWSGLRFVVRLKDRPAAGRARK